jgi:hypothetical protein
MASQGTFGYIIGRKKRTMNVMYDADLLWQVLVREIYILIKHYGSKDALKLEFEKIKTTKRNPTRDDIEKCKIFADFEFDYETDWSHLLRHCQSSYINVLNAGYLVNESKDAGFVFMLDFNKGLVSFHNNSKQVNTATLDEIMEFEEMPTKSYTELVNEMREKFQTWYQSHVMIIEEISKLNNLKQIAKAQCAVNIEEKVNKLIYDIDSEKKQHLKCRRFFYNRLKALELIEDEKHDDLKKN